MSDFFTLCCSHLWAQTWFAFLTWKGSCVPESISAFLLKPEAFKLQPTFSAEPSGSGSVGLVAHHAGKHEVLHLRCSFLAQLRDTPLDPWLVLSVHLLPPRDGFCFSFLSSRILVCINFCSPPLLRKSVSKALGFQSPSSNFWCESMCSRRRN